MRLGILGATGMLGHHVALAAQAEGHELVVLHRARARLDRLRGLHWQGRICDLDEPATLVQSLRGLDGVVNAAAHYPGAPRPLGVGSGSCSILLLTRPSPSRSGATVSPCAPSTGRSGSTR